MADEDVKKTDWIDWVVALGGGLGFNKVRLRWKLMGWRDSWKTARHRTRSTMETVRYQHKVCPYCGTVQDKANKNCFNCGRALGPQFLQVLRRFGLVAFNLGSVSTFLTAGILITYLRTVLAQGGFDFFQIDGQVLLAFGANWGFLIHEGQWWRYSTYIFLHAGIMHLFFNLFALQQLGPQIEEVFGKGRMLFFFMATGIVAGVGSGLVHPGALSIGASGSLMGLCGLFTGWGQRDGTPTGKALRDMGLTWCLYTVVFGFVIGADNAAHVAGFIGGVALGFFSKPQWERQPGLFDMVLSFVGIILAVGTFFLVLFPPR